MSRHHLHAAWTPAIAFVQLYASARIALNPLRTSHDCALCVQAGERS